MASNALAVAQPGAILPADNEFDKMWRMADAFAKSGILPRGIPKDNPAAVLYIVQTGYELGIPPGAALRMIALVEGKPTLDAQMQRALIFRDHGDDALIFEETDALHCVISYKRRGWKERMRFTLRAEEIAEALRRKDNWRNYPANMLRARATTFVANMAFSDSTLGLYATDEMVEAAGGDVSVGADGEPQVVSPPVRATITPIRDAVPSTPPPSDRQRLQARMWALAQEYFGGEGRPAERKAKAEESLREWIASEDPDATHDGKPSVRALSDERVAWYITALEAGIAEAGTASEGETSTPEAEQPAPAIEDEWGEAEQAAFEQSVDREIAQARTR